jgi:hypothetical protein
MVSCQNQNGFKFSPPQATKEDSTLKPAIVLSDSGWIELFDGNTISDWHTYGQKTAGSAWNTDSFSIHLKPGLKNGYQEYRSGNAGMR